LGVGFLRQHSAFLVRASTLVDSALIFLSLYGVALYYGEVWTPSLTILGLTAVITFELLASFCELYRSWRVIRLRYEIVKIFIYWTAAVVVVVALLYLAENRALENPRLLLSWYAVAVAGICIFHIVMRLTVRVARAFGFDGRRAAFLGATGVAASLERTFAEHPWMGIKVIGFFDDRQDRDDERVSPSVATISGDMEQLVSMARANAVDIVYICLPMSAETRIRELIDAFSDTTVSVYYCPSFFGLELMHARWDEVYGQPVVSIVESPFSGHERFLKRLEDIVITVGLLPVLLPLMLVIALAVKLTSPGPVFFTQSRYGINGQKFKMLKFRSMYVDDCGTEFRQVTRNDRRITPVGRFLRKTSLDELPQFFNVLLGDMSVVGPRPHPDSVNEELRTRIYRYMVRHKIKPGITGLAQVNGFRRETETLEKMEARIREDLTYIRTWSLLLDIKILIKTLFRASGEHVY
jgi:putative colanic acid biosynthesis UDP-glucose lipid carrier transferase